MKTQRWKLRGHRSLKCLSWGLNRKMVFLFPSTNTTYDGRKWYVLARYDMVNFLSCRPEVTTSHAIKRPGPIYSVGLVVEDTNVFNVWSKVQVCTIATPKSTASLTSMSQSFRRTCPMELFTLPPWMIWTRPSSVQPKPAMEPRSSGVRTWNYISNNLVMKCNYKRSVLLNTVVDNWSVLQYQK